MAHYNQTIHDMFNALQNSFCAFLEFEDVPASVLEAEKVNETWFVNISNMDEQVAA
jgi:hypothetical protein